MWLRLKVISGVWTGVAHVVTAAALGIEAVTGEPGSLLSATADALAVMAEFETKPFAEDAEVGPERMADGEIVARGVEEIRDPALAFTEAALLEAAEAIEDTTGRAEEASLLETTEDGAEEVAFLEALERLEDWEVEEVPAPTVPASLLYPRVILVTPSQED